MESPTLGLRRQWLLLGSIFAGAVALLAVGYFLFLHTDYVALAEALKPADASAIVAELDKGHHSYRLRDGGTTILVPEGEADATRIAIAGSDAAARGQIGFELFNKSDMGLTNFAQKINYQRALQGELARTIMATDGVDSARVHLALPERTLFRSDRTEPKAAATVTMKPGQVADAARVAGIQQLIAAAVPDLPQSKVVVLDSGGRVISPAPAVETEAERPADLEEKAAVEGYYRARARGAVERQMPGVKFLLRVLALPTASTAVSPGADSTESSGWVPSGEGANRNFRLRLIFVTEAPLAPADQAVARDAILHATAIDPGLGDSLSFEAGPVDRPIPAAQPAPIAAPAALPEPAASAPALAWPGTWLWIPLGLLLSALLVWRWRRAPAAHLKGEDHEAFAARLRRQLNLEGSDAPA